MSGSLYLSCTGRGQWLAYYAKKDYWHSGQKATWRGVRSHQENCYY